MIEANDIPKSPTITFRESADSNTQSAPKKTFPMVIFCIDNSGSMGTSKSIKGGINMNLRAGLGAMLFSVNRLQCVQAAVHAQIENLKKIAPETICVLISFENEVEVIG